MKFGQIIEYNKRKIFLQKSVRKRGRRLVPDLFLFFFKYLDEVKENGLQFSLNIF